MNGHDVMVVNTQQTRSIVLDLGRTGYNYRGALYEFLVNSTIIDDDRMLDGIVDSIYRVTLRDLADLFGRPDMGAIKELIDFPSSDSTGEVLDHLNFTNIDQLASICRDHCVGIYMYILQQFSPVENASYLLVKAGMDYLALNEFIPVSGTVLHRSHLVSYPEINSGQYNDGSMTVRSIFADPLSGFSR